MVRTRRQAVREEGRRSYSEDEYARHRRRARAVPLALVVDRAPADPATRAVGADPGLPPRPLGRARRGLPRRARQAEQAQSCRCARGAPLPVRRRRQPHPPLLRTVSDSDESSTEDEESEVDEVIGLTNAEEAAGTATTTATRSDDDGAQDDDDSEDESEDEGAAPRAGA